MNVRNGVVSMPENAVRIIVRTAGHSDANADGDGDGDRDGALASCTPAAAGTERTV